MSEQSIRGIGRWFVEKVFMGEGLDIFVYDINFPSNPPFDPSINIQTIDYVNGDIDGIPTWIPHSPEYQWMGRKLKDRYAIARAFVAKAVYDFNTTSGLIEALKSMPNLRRICGFDGIVISENNSFPAILLILLTRLLASQASDKSAVLFAAIFTSNSY